MQTYPIRLQPDLDSSWAIAPGAVTNMANLAPLQRGGHGTLTTANYLGASTINKVGIGYMFRKIAGTVDLFVAAEGDIDQYAANATRTNKVTGWTSATDPVCMASFGDVVIFASYGAATKFWNPGDGTVASLGGGSPSAKFVASNKDFVMMACYNDGTAYQDGWWCSALQNYASWTTSIATQAANGRLLSTPGPITGLRAYRDRFLAFKENSFYIGTYIGPPWIWQWDCVSRSIGTAAPLSVVECDSKIYFLHSTGFYEFDGANLKNIGLPVFQQFLSYAGYIDSAIGSSEAAPTGDTLVGVNNTFAQVDDIDGVVWFFNRTYMTASSQTTQFGYGYNVRTGQWGTYMPTSYDSASIAVYPVVANYSDIQTFKSSTDTRFLQILSQPSSAAQVRSVKYPVTPGTSYYPSITTGLFGDIGGNSTMDSAYIRLLPGSASPTFTGTAYGYNKEHGSSVTSATVSHNSEFDRVDFTCNAKFKKLALTAGATKLIVAGVGVDNKATGKR